MRLAIQTASSTWVRRRPALTFLPPTQTPKRADFSRRHNRHSSTLFAEDAGASTANDDIDAYGTPDEKAQVSAMLERSFVGCVKPFAPA